MSEETKKKISIAQSGSKSFHAKLSKEDVLDIRERLKNKEKQALIAKVYGVHPSVISDINTKKKYREEYE